MHRQGDTIAAIATPVGLGGIGIVRMSGPSSLEILKNVFEPARPCGGIQSRRLYFGYLRNPITGRIVDQVLASYMKAPRSYTGEDVVEINSHSGPLLLSTILDILVSQGARAAGPGEFTFRAFMNGRIDLSQAEAIADLIAARSEAGMSAAASQMKGALGEEIRRIKNACLLTLAEVEAAIDFPDEMETGYDAVTLATVITDAALRPLDEIIREGEQARLAVLGAKTAIVGSSNAGKSSLFNRLLKQERAIVTPLPGTTRDIIESELLIKGLPIRLMDTAGIREARDQAEIIGMEMTQRAIEKADLLLLVLDRSRPISKEDVEVMKFCRGRKTLIVLNKKDLEPVLDHESFRRQLPDCSVVEVSALTGEGLPELKEAVLDELKHTTSETMQFRLVPNMRQKEALKEASEAFVRARNCLSEGLPAEILALELRTALECLNRVTGENLSDEVLEEIFSRFCIGK